MLTYSNTNPTTPKHSTPFTTHTMEKAYKLMRRSIHAFLQSYRPFASIAGLLVFPVSASILLSQALNPSSSPTLRTISSRLASLFQAAGLPASSQFFSFLNLKLSQTIFSFFSTLPFALTFLIFAKASVARIVHSPPPLSSLVRLYRSLLLTHLFNSFVILSSNAAVFSLLFLLFNTADVLRFSSSTTILVLSAVSAVLYSVVLANTMVVCNLAIVVSAIENCGGGYAPFLRACVLLRGREATAMTLALPVNLAMAAIEALFQYRVVKPYHRSSKSNASVVWEAFLIIYMYSLLIVLDVVVSCKLFKSCKSYWEDEEHHQSETEPEEKVDLQA